MARLAQAFRARRPVGAADPRRGAAWTLLFLTLLIAALTPASAVVVFAIFDGAISEDAPVALAGLVALGGLAIVAELMLRRERSTVAADVGVRAAAALSARWFRALLAQDRAGPASTQIAQYRLLRRLRRTLTGPAVTALLDAPAALLLTVLLFVFAGPMGLMTPLAVALHATAAWIVHPHARSRAMHGARARERLRAALTESAAKRAVLDDLGVSPRWAARVESLAVEVADRRRDERVSDAAVEAVTQGVGAVTLLVAIWLAAALAEGGALTVGMAVASVLVIWRSIAPVETIVRAWTDIAAAIRESRRPHVEATTRATHPAAPRVEGRIAIRGLVAAYGVGAPALRGVSLDVAPGEIVAICGPAGAGKTTLLMALLGMVRPQAGTVVVDGADLRNVDPSGYRTQVAWSPQKTTLFHGTVAQNIRLLAPGADEAAMAEALAHAGLALPHPQLPQGVETRLMSGGAGQVDESLRVKIMLAGLYARGAKLLLLDDPGAFLDRDGDRAFVEALAALRGKATVLLVTNRPSHMRACDRIVRLDHGMVVSDGATAQVLVAPA